MLNIGNFDDLTPQRKIDFLLERIASKEDIDFFLGAKLADVLEITAQRESIELDVHGRRAEQIVVEYGIETDELVLGVALEHGAERRAAAWRCRRRLRA